MRYVRSEQHRRHFPDGELSGTRFVRPYECPERWEYVRGALDSAGLADGIDPDPLDMALVGRVHTERYLSFLESAWADWTDAGHEGQALPLAYPCRGMNQDEPDDIVGKLGYFGFCTDSAITDGTWAAATSSAAVAVTAQRLVADGEPVAFGLCRPPGHHAAADLYGGYCFLNNAALAAQALRDGGAERVAVLDVDFHHGNGTQAIFYERSDVFFASLHGDPRREFPYFLGRADETGRGDGEGGNANYPLPPGTGFEAWFEALIDATGRITAHGVDALVVSLGVDTFEQDPISSFTLASDDFTAYGRHLGSLGLPTVYVMEGGYAVAEIGINTVNVLTGHLEGMT